MFITFTRKTESGNVSAKLNLDKIQKKNPADFRVILPALSFNLTNKGYTEGVAKLTEILNGLSIVADSPVSFVEYEGEKITSQIDSTFEVLKITATLPVNVIVRPERGRKTGSTNEKESPELSEYLD